MKPSAPPLTLRPEWLVLLPRPSLSDPSPEPTARSPLRIAEFRTELTATRQLCYLAAVVADEKGWKACNPP